VWELYKHSDGLPGPHNTMSEGLAHRHALNTHLEKYDYRWLLFALQHNERANAEGIAFVRSLRGVHTIWRDTCDDVMGNPHWLAPSVNGGFAFVEDEMPVLIDNAIQSILNRNPMQHHFLGHGSSKEKYPVFQQNVAGIVQAIHMYSSDMPTQARIMHGLVRLFSTPAIVLHVRRMMEDFAYSMPLVSAVLKTLQLYRREYAIAMICLDLLRLLCRNRFTWQEFGIECGTVRVLLEIINTEDQPITYAKLRIACYKVLMQLCELVNTSREELVHHGGLPILYQVLVRDMHWTESAAENWCVQFTR